GPVAADGPVLIELRAGDGAGATASDADRAAGAVALERAERAGPSLGLRGVVLERPAVNRERRAEVGERAAAGREDRAGRRVAGECGVVEGQVAAVVHRPAAEGESTGGRVAVERGARDGHSQAGVLEEAAAEGLDALGGVPAEGRARDRPRAVERDAA